MRASTAGASSVPLTSATPSMLPSSNRPIDPSALKRLSGIDVAAACADKIAPGRTCTEPKITPWPLRKVMLGTSRLTPI